MVSGYQPAVDEDFVREANKQLQLWTKSTYSRTGLQHKLERREF